MCGVLGLNIDLVQGFQKLKGNRDGGPFTIAYTFSPGSLCICRNLAEGTCYCCYCASLYNKEYHKNNCSVIVFCAKVLIISNNIVGDDNNVTIILL